MNITLNVPLGTPVADVVDYVKQLQIALAADGVEIVGPRKERGMTERVQGPLELEWCKYKGVKQVVCRNGLSHEEQARHNLVQYAGWTDARLNAVLAASPESETPASVDESRVIEEIPDSEVF